jgi:DNA-directed RNA polymerase subunit RPC12/RpoP
MYVLDKPPRRNYAGWSSALPNGYYKCIMPDELEELPIGRKYIHRCYKCKKPMQEVNEREFLEQLDNGKIKCPKCGGKMSEPSLILWD